MIEASEETPPGQGCKCIFPLDNVRPVIMRQRNRSFWVQCQARCSMTRSVVKTAFSSIPVAEERRWDFSISGTTVLHDVLHLQSFLISNRQKIALRIISACLIRCSCCRCVVIEVRIQLPAGTNLKSSRAREGRFRSPRKAHARIIGVHPRSGHAMTLVRENRAVIHLNSDSQNDWYVTSQERG